MARNDSKASFKVYLDFQTTGKSIKEVDAEYKKLNNTIRRDLIPGSKEYNAAVAKQRELGKVLDDHRNKVKGVGGVWQSLSKEVKAFGMIAIGALGFQAITGQINNLIRRTADLSDAYANVQKTTGLTAAEVEALGKELGKIDTRTSRMELLKLASEAGKLGITGAGNIKKFVDEADKINVALGEDLGEGAILAIGKLSDVFGTGMLNIGSAINSLGAASAASEGYLVDFAARLGGIAKTAGISAPDILGYGAVLDSLGLQAEMSSTALSNFFIDFTKNVGKFESAAGMASGSLSELIGKEGTNAGFLAFLENLKASSSGADDFLRRLEKLGIDGSRGAQVFLTLSNNIGKVKDQQKIANTEFEKGTSIIDEFNTKNNNFAANLDKLQKRISNFFTNNMLTNGIQSLINKWSEYLEIPISEKLEKEQASLNGLVSSIIQTNNNEETRLSLIKQLQSEYPDFIGNIDAERISNEYLRDRLKEVNEQYVNKIILQKQQEKIQKEQTKAADEFLKSQEMLIGFNKQAAKMEKEFGLADGGNLTTDERMSRLKTVIEARSKSNNIFQNIGLSYDSGILIEYYENALQYEAKYQESKYKSNKLLEDFQKLQKELSTEISKIDANDPLGLGKAFGSGSSISANIDNVTDKVKKLKEQTIELNKILPKVEPEISGPIREGLNTVGGGVDALYSRETNTEASFGLDGTEASRRVATREDEVLGRRAEEAAQAITEVGNTVLPLVDNIFAAINTREQAALQEFIDSEKQKLEILEERYRRGEISQQQYENAVRDSETRIREEQKKAAIKQARREKAIRIFDTIINTAAGIAKAVAASPLTGGLPFSAIVGATGAAQIAAIAATPLPQFKRGGFTFANGGPVMQPKVGLIGEAGPEWVAPNWMLRNPATADVIGALEAMRTNNGAAFYKGGFTKKQRNRFSNFEDSISEKAGVDVGFEKGEARQMPERQYLLIKGIFELVAQIAEKDSKPAVIGWNDGDTRELQEKQSRYTDILNDNTLS